MSPFERSLEINRDKMPDKVAMGYFYGWKKLGWQEQTRTLVSNTASMHPGWLAMYPRGVTTHWTDAPVEAQCHCSDDARNKWNASDVTMAHVPPVFMCSCGIYAFRTIRELLDNSAGIAFYEPVVRIRCWGKIVDHEWGFRAQHAQISRVVIPYTPKPQGIWKELLGVREYDYQTTYVWHMTEALQAWFPLSYLDPRDASDEEIVDFYTKLEMLDATPAQQIPLSEVPQEELDKYLQR